MDIRISVSGLGYVGLPMAVELSKHFPVVGFDTNPQRVSQLRDGLDATGEVSSQQLSESTISFTGSAADLRDANFHIIAVPTPTDSANVPDFSCLESASKTVGTVLSQGDTVVYESTVYPGATEEICVPILEASSGLKVNQGFTVGYSPERINPSDKTHTFTTIQKVVAGSTEETTQLLAEVYGTAVTAGTFKAASIKVAEAAKVIENTQRDINIALINELAVIFDRLNIRTHDVLEAAATKWNFLKFQPGLVGGHCIGVDPYYLTYKAKQIGLHPEVVLAGRRINDSMASFITSTTIKRLSRNDQPIHGGKVGVFGITFKENCSDLRNSKALDIVRELTEYGIEVFIHDPVVEENPLEDTLGITNTPREHLPKLNGIIIATAHKPFIAMPASQWQDHLTPNGVVIDVKGVIQERKSFSPDNLWQL